MSQPTHEHTIDVLRELGVVIKGSSEAERIALLVLFEAGEPIPMGHLAQRIGRSRGGMTSIADRLEKDKLVKRIHSAEDRRTVSLEIRAPGRAAIEKATALALEVLAA